MGMIQRAVSKYKAKLKFSETWRNLRDLKLNFIKQKIPAKAIALNRNAVIYLQLISTQKLGGILV